MFLDDFNVLNHDRPPAKTGKVSSSHVWKKFVYCEITLEGEKISILQFDTLGGV